MTVHHISRAPGPARRWRRALEQATALLEVISTREPDARDGTDLLACELDRAAIASVLEDERPARDEALVGAASAAQAAAIAAVRDRGSVELRLAGTPRLYPARQSMLSPGFWLMAWGAARVTRDADALSALAAPALLEGLGEIGDHFWTPIARALSALGAGAAAADQLALVADARSAASDPGLTVVEPGYVDHLVLPLLAVATEIVRRDQERFDEACAAAVRRHDEWFGAGERRFHSLGLLAFPVLGLAALAHDLGLLARVDSGYLPLDLARGSVVHPGGVVRYHYPPGRLHRSDEANWFLDLEGFPRAGRTHVLHEWDGRLWATYTARGAPGLAEATLSVEPPPVGLPLAPGPDDLLDIGELVQAADLLSRRAGDERLPLSERRAWLDEAGDCLAAVRARLVTARTGPDELLFGDRGRATYLAEPGRFDPERLEAVEATWRGRVNRWDAELAGVSRLSAFESTAVLQLELEPILRTLATDPTETTARALRPRPDDYGKVFVPSAVEAARARYEAFWDGPLDLRRPERPRSEILTYLAPAGMLADDNELSWKFPGGYRSIARHLAPERVWAAWKYVAPGTTTGLAYDGLVWCDDHWAWLPRPYRVLRGLD